MSATPLFRAKTAGREPKRPERSERLTSCRDSCVSEFLQLEKAGRLCLADEAAGSGEGLRNVLYGIVELLEAMLKRERSLPCPLARARAFARVRIPRTLLPKD